MGKKLFLKDAIHTGPAGRVSVQFPPYFFHKNPFLRRTDGQVVISTFLLASQDLIVKEASGTAGEEGKRNPQSAPPL